MNHLESSDPSLLATFDAFLPPARFLTNGRYTVFLAADGTGFSAWRTDPDGRTDLAITPRPLDRLRDPRGLFLYLRDREDGIFWSAGLHPTVAVPEEAGLLHAPGSWRFRRVDRGIATRLDVCVHPGSDLEVRRLVLANRSRRRRRIEVTSYAEVVLDTPESFRAHPAFSKLFLQTVCDPERGRLLVRRRSRSARDEHPWLLHALVGDSADEYETDRVRFLGRGHTTRAPAALLTNAPLSASTGNVLDPVVSLRRLVDLDAGEERELVFLLGIAGTRTAALELASGLGDADVDTVFRAADARARVHLRELGITGDEARRREEIGAARLFGCPAPGAAGPGEAQELPVESVPEVDPDPGSILRETAGAVTDGRTGATPVTPQEHWDPVRHAERLRDGCGRTGGPAAGAPHASASGPPASPEDLGFWNGVGGFSGDGREYVIRLPLRSSGGHVLPPQPWTNVIANEKFGCIVSETGAGPTWALNSREHRLTPWFNDALLDPHGEALYLRDEVDGTFWSPMPGPAPAPAPYEVRHGMGYSTFRLIHDGLEHESTCFVPGREPLKIVLLRLVNRGSRVRLLSAAHLARLVLGDTPDRSGRFVTTRRHPGREAMLAESRLPGDFPGRVAFAAMRTDSPEPAWSFTGHAASFLGRTGSPERPAALCGGGPLDGARGTESDACFAQMMRFELAPGGTAEVAVLLGEAADMESVDSLLTEFGPLTRCREALEERIAFWREATSTVRASSPSPALDLLVNGWLLYQTLACRLWARSAFYQSGGAYGFRDQLQDAAALVDVRPDLTRRQLLLHAAHQFVEGDVLHWWHPPAGAGIRTRFADDLLWLPLLTALYVSRTGDRSVLADRAPYLAGDELLEDEAYGRPWDSGTDGDLYDHCCRAIDRSLRLGERGLPLFGCGDWNDGMNRVGRGGRGESVWMAFFLHAVIGDFLPFCRERGDEDRVRRYEEHQRSLRSGLESSGWDGAWYRRGYYDDGAPLGSRESDECRIDALVQAWSVLSGAAPPERAAMAMDSAERHLVSEEEGIIRLLTPPFVDTPHDPGYIKGYVAGVRENGGQYTHAALWFVQALARLGRRNRAARLLDLLNPVHHALDPASVERYRVEPYVVAADVYGAPPHVGRGGWTWYTGSSGWMFRVALESIFGLRMEGGTTLVLGPCIPDTWPGYRLQYRVPSSRTVFEFDVRNPDGCSARIVRASLDGNPIDPEDGGVRIPVPHDGARHVVEVVLGGGSGSDA